jgi:hypothetical protein
MFSLAGERWRRSLLYHADAANSLSTRAVQAKAKKYSTGNQSFTKIGSRNRKFPMLWSNRQKRPPAGGGEDAYETTVFGSADRVLFAAGGEAAGADAD